jgi:DNA-binding NarL/FixJ family response regulator
MKRHKVAIVDDHLLFAEGIGRMVSEMPFCELSWIQPNAQKISERIKKTKVDLLILDINISTTENGLEIATRLIQIHPKLKIMFLSMYQPIDIGLSIAQLNGAAYVLKTSGKIILENALKSILINDQSFIDPNVQSTPTIRDNFTDGLRLTKREKEIIELLSHGMKNKEIAQQLFLSEHTVKTHRKNIVEKLGAEGVNDLIYKSGSNR